MDKLLEKVDKEINVLTEGDLNPQTIDTLGKLIDIKKDVSKIGYYKDIKEECIMAKLKVVTEGVEIVEDVIWKAEMVEDMGIVCPICIGIE